MRINRDLLYGSLLVLALGHGCIKKKVASSQQAAVSETNKTAQAIATERQALEQSVRDFYGPRGELNPIGDEITAGRWDMIEQNVSMQAIHMIAVPSDADAQGNPTQVKVLIVNGSSNRNSDEAVFPSRYADVDNASLYSPKVGTNGTLDRVPPIPVEWMRKFKNSDAPFTEDDKVKFTHDNMDLFCTGHLHTLNGDVLFVGGTTRYPDLGKPFLGNRAVWLWDWKNNRFSDTGLVPANGRWYPTLMPMADGRIFIISGVSDDPQQVSSGLFISNKIEVYDPRPKTPTLVATQNDNDVNRMMAQMGEVWDMYPRLAPLRDGRFLITGDGTGFGNRENQNTLFLKIDSDATRATISSQPGPKQVAMTKYYDAQLFDPRPGKEDEFLILGGQIGVSALELRENTPGQFIGATTDLSRFVPPKDGLPNGGFFFSENFLGGFRGAAGDFVDRRLNHVATYLPTGEFMILGGGNFGYLQPKFHPSYYIPDDEVKQNETCEWGMSAQENKPRDGFCRKLMNPHRFPRLYHTSAVLLQDGRILLGGGNVDRARWDGREPGRKLNLRPNGDWHSPQNPGEVQYFEVFSPPYKFRAQPEVSNVSTTRVRYNEEFSFQVKGANLPTNRKDFKVTFVKLGSVTHSMDNGQRFANLEVVDTTKGLVKVRAPQKADANLFPPGYYMMFYVDKITRTPSREGVLVNLSL